LKEPDNLNTTWDGWIGPKQKKRNWGHGAVDILVETM
jgi:hypothetical protein